jgi:hypothetical protein
MSTTSQYLHLADVVFRDEAAALEDRLLCSRKFYRRERTSDDLSEAEASEQASGFVTAVTCRAISAGCRQRPPPSARNG